MKDFGLNYKHLGQIPVKASFLKLNMNFSKIKVIFYIKTYTDKYLSMGLYVFYNWRLESQKYYTTP